MRPLLILCLLAVAVPAFSEDRRADLSKLTIMNFNVEFMWDGIEPEEGSGTIRFAHRGDSVKAAAKMAKIAEITPTFGHARSRRLSFVAPSLTMRLTKSARGGVLDLMESPKPLVFN